MELLATLKVLRSLPETLLLDKAMMLKIEIKMFNQASENTLMCMRL